MTQNTQHALNIVSFCRFTLHTVRNKLAQQLTIYSILKTSRAVTKFKFEFNMLSKCTHFHFPSNAFLQFSPAIHRRRRVDSVCFRVSQRCQITKSSTSLNKVCVSLYKNSAIAKMARSSWSIPVMAIVEKSILDANTVDFYDTMTL